MQGSIKNSELGGGSDERRLDRDLALYGDVHLPHHLLTMGLHEHLLFLLRDVDFLSAKVAASGADDLLADLRAAWDGVPLEFDSRVNPDKLQSLRLQLADNLRLFAREGFKFEDRVSGNDRVDFDRHYLYGAQRWELDALRPQVREQLNDLTGPVWSLRWIVDREAHALEESRVFNGGERFLLSLDGRRLMVARTESIDAYDTTTWRKEDSIPFADANVLENIAQTDQILIANTTVIEVWDLLSFERVRSIKRLASSGSESTKLVGDRFAFFGADYGITKVELESGDIEVWSSPCRITAWCPTPDGSRVIAGDIEYQLRSLDGDSADNVLGAHDDFITSVAITPDGQACVTGSQDGLIRRWNLKDVSDVASLGKARFSIQTLMIDRDGKFLVATTVPYGRFGRMLKDPEDESTLEIATVVAGTQEDVPTDALVWRLTDWQFAGELSEINSEVNEIGFSPSGRWMMMGYVNGSVELWDMDDDALAAGSAPVNSDKKKQPDPTKVVAAGIVRNMLIIVVVLIGLVIAHSASVWTGIGTVLGGVALTWFLNAAGVYLALRKSSPRDAGPSPDIDTLSKDMARATILVAALAVLIAMSTIWINPWLGILGVAAAPTLARIVASFLPPAVAPPEQADQKRQLMPRRYGGHGASISWLRMSPGEDRLFSASRQDSTLKVWRIGDAEASQAVSHDGDLQAIAPIPGRPWVTSAGADGRLAYWDVRTGACHGIGKGHSREVTAMSVAVDGSYVVTSSKDHKVIVWWLTGQIPQGFSGHEAIVSDVKSLSDGRVASVDMLGNLLVWEVSTGETVLHHEFSDQPTQAHITKLAVAPDESHLIGIPGGAFGFHKILGMTLNIDNPITPMVDLKTGESIGRLPLATGIRFLDGQKGILHFVSNRLQRLDINSARWTVLGTHDDDIIDVIVTPSADHALSIGSDNTIRTWDLSTNQMRDVRHIPGMPRAIAFLHSGAISVVGTDRGNIYAFRTLDLGKLTSVRVDGTPNCFGVATYPDDNESDGLFVGDDAGRVYCFDFLNSS